MITVGIIANPASGKDIRRLVAHGSVFDNDEKVSIVRRALLGLEAVGVERVLFMPDSFGIVHKALGGVRLALEAMPLAMPLTFTQDDSRHAAALLDEQAAGCIITLGGDGTNRAVAKACGDVPLMPVSTGTNNVFPTLIEGTIAGMGAGLVARGLATVALRRAPRLDVFLSPPHPPTPSPTRGEGEPTLPLSPAWESGTGGEGIVPDDIALVDAAVYDERFIAARAIWDVSKIREVVLTRAAPGSIGLSSIGAHLLGGDHPADRGLYLRMAPGGRRVLAPIAPGLIEAVSLAEHRLLAPGEEVVIRSDQPCVLALDGEREIGLRPGMTVRLRLNADGPWVVDPRKAIEVAARAGAFLLS